MWIIKIMGVLLVIGTSILISMFFLQKRIYRLEILQEFKQLGLLLRADIRQSSVTVPEAIEGIQMRVNGKVSEFLCSVLDKMNSFDRKNIEEIWKESIGISFMKTELLKEDIIILERLGRIIGFLDKQLQIENLNQYIYEIEEQIKKSKDEISDKKRIYRVMGVFGGMIIVLIFI